MPTAMFAPDLVYFAVAVIFRHHIISWPFERSGEACGGTGNEPLDRGGLYDRLGSAIPARPSPSRVALVFLGGGKSKVAIFRHETQFNRQHLPTSFDLVPSHIELGELVDLIAGRLEDTATELGKIDVGAGGYLQKLAQSRHIAPPNGIAPSIQSRADLIHAQRMDLLR